jgi:hypothetical protein
MSSLIEIRLVYSIASELSASMKRYVEDVVAHTARDILRDAQASMTGAKHGRVYRHGKVLHQASAPFEAPAIDTGALYNSGYVEEITPLEYEVGFSVEYAAILEGVHSQFESGGLLDMADALGVWMAPRTEMLPRPFLRPAVEAQREVFERAMRKVMR